MSKRDRSVTLDVVENSLWVDVKAYTTAERAPNADARLVAPVVSELPVGPSSSSDPNTPNSQTAREPRGSSAEHLDRSAPIEDMQTRCESYERQCRAQKHRCGVAYWKEE